ncbi:MAG: D-2-hydroxyacid dehydrogenase [Alphaproteobacteria bacterium]|jgi:phosphoglycerate dehydrogenase-like enzyme|nr:D-2-hydroxyacid dehydrogenase [Alphaproteobacteria bacterium]
MENLAFTLVMMPPHNEIRRSWAARVAAEDIGVKVLQPETIEDAKRDIAQADAAFGVMPAEVLEHATRLRWLQAPMIAPPAGYYHQALIDHPVVVTNQREIFNDHIGAHIMAYVLAFARGLHYYLPQQARREYAPRPLNTGVVHLPEATALILGVGGIGAEASRLCKAFGMTVVGVDGRREELPEGMDEMHPPERLDEQLARADFVIMTIPHTPETEGLMDRERLGHMKSSAFLINIGRGMTVRLDDLVAVLEAGGIAGAALDVFEIEPLPSDHALWTAPNVLITPHTAGFGPYLDDRRLDILLDNCRRFAKGEALRNVVDKSVWF